MNDLMIPVNHEHGEILVNGRDLHAALEIRTQYSTWIDRMIKEFDFIEGVDFYSNLNKTPNSNGGRPSVEYFLTLDMSKEICMITRNGRGKVVRKYFIQVEKDWNTPERILTRALEVAGHVIHELESRPTIMNATNEELLQELDKRLA